MNESYKCIECGENLQEGMTECPNCGCPVDERRADVYPEWEEKHRVNENAIIAVKSFKINPFAIVSILVGVVILILGINLSKEELNVEQYYAKQYSVDYAAFGGDFYTEIYGASDTIVDELNSINGGLQSLSTSISSITGTITHVSSMIIIAIGLATISGSLLHIRKRG